MRFDPIYLGDLNQAVLLESLVGMTEGVAREDLDPSSTTSTSPTGLSAE